MDVSNNLALRHQPLKALYLTYVLLTLLLFRLPVWILISLVPRFRPRPTWTFRRTIFIRLLQTFCPVIFDIAAFSLFRVDPHQFAQYEDEIGLVWIDANPELVQGEVEKYARLNKVSPVQVPAYWFGYRDPATNLAGQRALPDEKVIINFHAGGGVMGDASPNGVSAVVCNDMMSHFPQFNRVLNVEYRLSQGPPLLIENPFPAALIDAVTAYDYLVDELGFSPQNILVMGESAGGTLAHQLARYLVTAQLPTLPPPRALLLESPSMDWGDSHMTPGTSANRNIGTDWVHAFGAGYTTRASLGRLTVSDASQSSLMSTWDQELPEGEPRATFADTLILAGDAEMTLDAMKKARDRLAREIGQDKVQLIVQKDATHVALCLPWHEREKEEAYRLIAPWTHCRFDSV